MDTFMQIKELASKLSRDCFTEDQYIIITGVDCSTNKMFAYTSGDFFGIIATLANYIQRLEKNNPLGITKFQLLGMIRKSFEEDDRIDEIRD